MSVSDDFDNLAENATCLIERRYILMLYLQIPSFQSFTPDCIMFIHSLLQPLLCKLLSISGRIVSSQFSLLDHPSLFVLVSLFLVCLPVLQLSFSAEKAYHNALLIYYVSHERCFCFSGCLSLLFPLHQCYVVYKKKDVWYEKSKTNYQHCSVAPHFKSVHFVVYCF